MPAIPRGNDEAATMGDLPTHRNMEAREIADQDLVTTIMRLSEILSGGIALRSNDHPLPTPHFATPEDHDEHTLPHDFRQFAAVLHNISHLMTHDPKLAHQASHAREAFGDGEVLKILFRSLFPNQQSFRCVHPDGTPILTAREVDVLREAAGDIGHEEIALRLKVSPRTVSTHLNNIYRKLNVQRPLQAVARAISMGYLDTNVLAVIEAAGHNGPRNYRLFDTVATSGYSLLQPAFQYTLRPITEFALLLLAATARTTNYIHCQNEPDPTNKPGMVCVIDGHGRIVRTFGQEQIRKPGGLAIIPPSAARQGFTPGNLLVSHQSRDEIGLNGGRLTEFTPDGRSLRTFAGGKEIGTRLTSNRRPAFHRDGRLLMASGCWTDAILAFRRGGATVRRFIEAICTGIAVNDDGTIYTLRYSGVGSSIDVYSPSGKRLHSFGQTEAGGAYCGIVLGAHGTIWVTRNRFQQGEIELQEFSPNGERQRTLSVSDVGNSYDIAIDFAIDEQQRLFVPCTRSRTIQVLSPSGERIHKIALHNKILPRAVAIPDNGLIYVTGEIA